MNAGRTIEIYDTTLRDGNQGEGVNLSLSDKLQIADLLDQLGVTYLEGGWPGSNPKDNDFFLACQDRTFEHLKISAFGSTHRADCLPEDDTFLQMLVSASSPKAQKCYRIVVFCKFWVSANFPKAQKCYRITVFCKFWVSVIIPKAQQCYQIAVFLQILGFC